MTVLKKFFCALAAVFAVLPVFAQSGVVITAVIQDDVTSEPVPFATVSVTKKGAKSPVRFCLSTEEGKVSLDKIPAGTYLLKADLMGYVSIEKEVVVAKKNIDLGVVKMKPDATVLDAASVSAVGNPIVMKKDTIEYNASSFKTTDNDMLEDLLKKLPGVEVGEDGSLTANGQTIKKITIDGKTFFLDDPQMASKNLPANIIEKVKVVQKKSDQAAFTGIDDGEEETVIDLNIQKGRMNGLIGNASAGAGHDIMEKASGSSLSSGSGDMRYQGGAFLGRFNEDGNIALILNGNNTNNRGFSDISGNMMGDMRGGGGMGGGRGGWGGNGITTSYMIGLNASSRFFDDKMEAGGHYGFNVSQKSVEEKSSKTTYLENRNLLNDSEGFNNTNTYGHRIGARIEHKFSENTSIIFEPQFNMGWGDYSEFSKTSTMTQVGDDISRTNEGFTSTSGDNKNWNTSGFLLFRQRLGIPGRTLTVHTRYNFSGNTLDGYNQSLTASDWDQTLEKYNTNEIVNQRVERRSNSNSLNARLTYTEPLGGGFYAEASYSAGYNINTSKKNSYDNADNTGFGADNRFYSTVGETLNETYSNTVLNRAINQNASANVMYQDKKFHAQLGLGVNPTNTHNETNGKVYDNTKVKWAPRAMLWYEISELSNIRLFYYGRSDQPSTSQLMAVPNNSDPLNISFGNPHLTPFFNHSARSEFRYSDKKTFTSFNVSIEGGFVQDPIVNANWYGSDGVQFSMPVNGHTSGNGGIRWMFNSPIAKSNFSVFWMSNARYSQSSSYVGSTFDVGDLYKDGIFDYDGFHEKYPDLDKVEAFTRNVIQTANITERIRFTYRNDFVELSAGGRTRTSRSWYTVKSSTTDWTFNNQVQASANLTLPAGFGFVTDLNYNWYNGYQTPQEDEFVINAQVTKLLFKKKATLSVRVFDILNQAKNLSVNDNANFHSEVWNNTLGRYIMCSFTYRFGSFGGRGGAPHGGPGGFRGARR